MADEGDDDELIKHLSDLWYMLDGRWERGEEQS